jgi:hypothetical protein
MSDFLQYKKYLDCFLVIQISLNLESINLESPRLRYDLDIIKSLNQGDIIFLNLMSSVLSNTQQPITSNVYMLYANIIKLSRDHIILK